MGKNIKIPVLLYCATILILNDFSPVQCTINIGSQGLGFNSILNQLNKLDPFQIFDRKHNPDIHLPSPGLITKYGYPVESHEVTTSDGYILTLHRIPHGKNEPSSGSKRPVALLQHGLISSSDDWLLNSPNKSLAFRLADAGYDVWLGNARGNRYSRKHRDLSPKRIQFWRFGFHEVGTRDLPAMIDFALNKTGQAKLQFIGHDLGTTKVLALLSTRPEYNNKISLVSALAPVVFANNMRSPIRFLAPFSHIEAIILDILGQGELLPSFIVDLLNNLIPSICTPQHFAASLCESPLYLFAGFNPGQANYTQLPIILGHRTSTSSRMFIHYMQLVTSPTFRQYDYGFLGNRRYYDTEFPPDYTLKNATVPFEIYWGDNDLLADPKDVARLAAELPNVVINHQVAYRKWNHLDFLFGVDADKLVYDPLIENMQKYN